MVEMRYIFIMFLLAACTEHNLYKTKLEDGSVDCCWADCYHYCNLTCIKGSIRSATNFKVISKDVCGTQLCHPGNPGVCEPIKELQ
jgi:hypothetical protein